MTELLTSLVLMGLLMASTGAGLVLQRGLQEIHRSRDTIDAVRLVITMLITFAALVLGLLTSSVKSTFDKAANDLRGFAIGLIQLDQRLRQYGPDADPVRVLLRSYTAAAIADTWPREEPPKGDYPQLVNPIVRGSLESSELGEMLSRIDSTIRQLTPRDPFHTQLAAAARGAMAQVQQTRWRLIEEAHSSISWPFLSMLVLWLMLAFLTFGLTSPRNSLVYAAVLFCALSVSSALYVIIYMDTPLGGYIVISTQPLRDALLNMNQPASYVPVE